ncbi:hypothetical protein [Streptomyces sp. NPDC057623]|uniref:hypothetical protein n=1 Tax=Streptomyces sp. NPDC057623 TaxID=3346187 RepID=UPI0036A3C55D
MADFRERLAQDDRAYGLLEEDRGRGCGHLGKNPTRPRTRTPASGCRNTATRTDRATGLAGHAH